ncbi:MAG: cell wall biosynthesis glycosyltransferase [Citricoccus sp.]|nr:cell wall biosynthesis glycosyltransferase [Citricoccus sp. WCRC_4]
MDGMTPLRRNPGSGQHPSGHHSSGAADNSGANPPEPQDAPGPVHRPVVPAGGPDGVPPSLGADLERAGFYPELVADVLDSVLDGRTVTSHLVHVDTHFDYDEIHRHITVLALAGDIMAALHLDDHALDDAGEQVMAQVSTEVVPLRRIDSVVATTVHPQPQDFRRGDPVAEVTLSVTWAGGQRIDLAPAACADPNCDADHGYTGTSAREDLVLRVAAEAEGQRAVDSALAFYRELRRATVDPDRERTGR